MEKNYIALITICIFSILAIGLCIEKILHPKYNGVQLVHTLKRDIKAIVIAFFTKEKERYIFDFLFFDEMRSLVKEYANLQFDITAIQNYLENEKVPFLGLAFMPKTALSEDECNKLVGLILLKFRSYMEAWGTGWKNFAFYSIGQNYIRIFVYYLEYPEDEKGFWKKYKTIIKLNQKFGYNMLEDELLNEELSRVG